MEDRVTPPLPRDHSSHDCSWHADKLDFLDLLDEPIRQFLVMRGGAGELRSILVFDQDDPAALKAYSDAERRGVDCVLLGADSIETLCRTHSVWMT